MYVDASEGARASFMAVCRQRSQRQGTGYTPEFHDRCAKVFTDAACDDADAVIRTCWEPRGVLPRDAGCATDDQCADGYCRLPSGAARGSTCGTCAVPIWGRRGTPCWEKRDVKCVAGLKCESNQYDGRGSCELPSRRGGDEGSSCSLAHYDSCRSGLYCSDRRCVRATIVPDGESCNSDDRQCAEGSTCHNHVCVKLPGIGDACGTEETVDWCNSWTTCGATKKCELREEALDCSSPSPGSSGPASPEPMKCSGAASSCDGRPAGTCAGQDGCKFVQHYHPDANGGGTFTYECEGTEVPCSAIMSEDGCTRQSGCRWE